jgi:hypothetical protein
MADKKPTKQLTLYGVEVGPFAKIDKPDELSHKHHVYMMLEGDNRKALVAAVEQLAQEVHGVGFADVFVSVKQFDDGRRGVKAASQYDIPVFDERGKDDPTKRVYGGDTINIDLVVGAFAKGPLSGGKPGISLSINSIQRTARGNSSGGGGSKSPFANNDVASEGTDDPVVVVEDEPSYAAAAPAPSQAADLSDEPPF